MLDFYLLGLARSGTTAFCDVLNLHPNIYCGVERFSIEQDPSSITFPDSFLDKRIEGNPVGIEHAYQNLYNQDLSAFKVIGDKMPRKFYKPSHLTKTNSNIFIYRSYAHTTQSWDARAENLKDNTWSNSRTGIFFFFDLLLCLNVLSISENMAIVDFDKLFLGDYQKELKYVFQSLYLFEENYPYDLFEKTFFRKKKDTAKICSDKRYNNIADRIKLKDFEKEFSCLDYSERVSLVREYSNFIKTNIADFFDFLLELIKPEEYEELFSLTYLIKNNFTNTDFSKYFPHVNSKFNLLLSIHDKKNKQSENKIIKIIGLFPWVASLHIDLSHIYAQKNELDKAIVEARQAIKLNEINPNFHHHLGNLYMRIVDLDAAEKAQNRAVDLNPNFPAPHIKLSHIYAQKNELDKAIVEAHQAIKLNEINPDFHHHLGNLYMRIGDLESAEKAQNRAVDLNPNFPAPHLKLSHIYAQKNELKKAIVEAHQAIKLNEGNPNFHHHLGNLYMRIGDLESAEKAQNKAMEIRLSKSV